MIKTPVKPSRPVLEFATIAKDAAAMHRLLQTYVSPKGKGPDMHYAIQHGQYANPSYNFFVINNFIVGAKPEEVVVIVNPKIVEKVRGTQVMHREGCMSFPFRHAIKVKRYDEILVEYQVPDEKGEKLISKKDKFTGLMAYIFQHELEHAHGRNIYIGTNSH